MEPETKYFVVGDTEAPELLIKTDFLAYQFQPDTQTWLEAPWLLDYFYGDEAGAKEISEEEANQLKSAETLSSLDPEQIAYLQHLSAQKTSTE